jgi:NADH:ubiquinone oxidoreductase subunit E
VPDEAYQHWSPIDTDPVDAILHDADHDPKRMLEILEATQAAYGYLPVAALKRISFGTGAWYAMVYGTATYYDHLRFQPVAAAGPASGRERSAADYLGSLDRLSR